MNDLNSMLSDKRKYKNLKSNINLIISELNKAIENLEIPSNKIGNSYNINSSSIDNGKISSVRQDLINRRNYLKNIVLVQINKEINELDNNIESMG